MTSRNRSAPFIALALLIATAPGVAAGQLIINGHQVALEHRLLPGEAGPSAPLEELIKYLGAEALPEDQGFRLRWGESQEVFLSVERLQFQDGLAYVPLARLASLLGAQLLSFADAHYLFTPRSELQSLSYADGAVRLRFSRLAPLEVERRGRMVDLRFHNSALRIAPRTGRFPQGPVEQIVLSLEEPDQVTLRLGLRPASDFRISRGAVDGEYGVEVRLKASQDGSQAQGNTGVDASDSLRLLRSQDAARLSPWTGYHREWRETAAGQVRIDYLVVKDFQSHYTLRVGLPSGGIGTLERLEEIARTQGGVVGINANFFDPNTDLPIGLILRDGQILSTSYGERAALGVDLFGKLTFFNPRVSVFLQVDHRELKLDGVNQLPGKKGLFLYTPHYRYPLRLPSAARIYQIGEGRVTDVFGPSHLPFARDSLILVSLGAEDDLLSLGERVKLSYGIEPPTFLPLRDAVSAGPLLLKDGRMIIDHQGEGFDPVFAQGRSARSGLGITAEGDLIMLVAAKDSGSVGVNLEELALLLRELGGVEALALDGGSSASLVFRQGSGLHSLGNRRIAVGLVLIPR